MRILELSDRDRITLEIAFECQDEFDNWMGARDFERTIIEDGRGKLKLLDDLDVTEAH